MDRRLPIAAGAGALALVAGGLGVVLAGDFVPDMSGFQVGISSPGTVAQRIDGDKKRKRSQPRRARAEGDPDKGQKARKKSLEPSKKAAIARDKARLDREVALSERDPQLEGADRAEARREYREERLIDVNMRLEGHALERGWDEQTTEDVRMVLIETSDRVSDALARVDKGRTNWEEIKSDLRGYRLKQAADVEALLGPEEFDTFVQTMDFERFSGEDPVRGRL